MHTPSFARQRWGYLVPFAAALACGAPEPAAIRRNHPAQPVLSAPKQCNEITKAGCRELCERYNPKACLLGGEAALEVSDPSDAVTFFSRGCELGEVTSCAHLGQQSFSGKGTPMDPHKGAEYLRRSCSQTGGEVDPRGCYELMERLANGRDIPRDESGAVAIGAFICDRLDSEETGIACAQIGVWASTGAGMAKDPVAAARYLEKACKLNNKNGCGLLAASGFEGELPVSPEVMIASARRACELGEQSICLVIPEFERKLRIEKTKPREPMATKFLGFSFMLTEKEFRRQCAATGATALSIPESKPWDKGVVCTGNAAFVARVLADSPVSAKFKKDRAVEYFTFLGSSISEISGKARSVLDLLTEKYGPPNTPLASSDGFVGSPVEAFERAEKICRTKPINVSQAWMFAEAFGPNFKNGLIRVVLDCAPPNVRLGLYFQGPDGLKLRMEQADSAKGNL